MLPALNDPQAGFPNGLEKLIILSGVLSMIVVVLVSTIPRAYITVAVLNIAVLTAVLPVLSRCVTVVFKRTYADTEET